MISLFVAKNIQSQVEFNPSLSIERSTFRLFDFSTLEENALQLKGIVWWQIDIVFLHSALKFCPFKKLKTTSYLVSLSRLDSSCICDAKSALRERDTIKFHGTHLYSWVERGSVRVKCFVQEHNTMSPARARIRAARSGDECTNHQATAPPQLQENVDKK